MKPLQQRFQQLRVPTCHQVSFASQSFPTHPGTRGHWPADSLSLVSPGRQLCARPRGRRMRGVVGTSQHVSCFTRAVFSSLNSLERPLVLDSALFSGALRGAERDQAPHRAAFLLRAPSPVDAGSEKQVTRGLSGRASVRRTRLGKGAVGTHTDHREPSGKKCLFCQTFRPSRGSVVRQMCTFGK